MTEQASFHRRESEGVPIIDASGEIDIANVDQLRAMLKDVGASPALAIIVSLKNVQYLDSHTIETLMDFSRRLTINRRRLLVVAPHGTPAGRILRITNLNLAIPLYDSTEEALVSLKQ